MTTAPRNRGAQSSFQRKRTASQADIARSGSRSARAAAEQAGARANHATTMHTAIWTASFALEHVQRGKRAAARRAAFALATRTQLGSAAPSIASHILAQSAIRTTIATLPLSFVATPLLADEDRACPLHHWRAYRAITARTPVTPWTSAVLSIAFLRWVPHAMLIMSATRRASSAVRSRGTRTGVWLAPTA